MISFTYRGRALEKLDFGVGAPHCVMFSLRWFGVLLAFSDSRSRSSRSSVLSGGSLRVGRDPPVATHPGDSSDFLMSFHDFSKPKNRKMSKKIKIEKKKVEKN